MRTALNQPLSSVSLRAVPVSMGWRSWVWLVLCLVLGSTTNPAGAAGARPELPARDLWSLKPVVRVEPPAVRDSAWVRSPLDAFVLKRLEEKGIAPAPPASRRVLIRRATFDLTGLPPTPEQVEAFLSDTSPLAFSRLIDRLLESPQYGERWGRHWLDVVRYADSNGLDENVAFGNAWRYRDYVIQSVNRDKPYNQFLSEQIAGDLLPGGGSEEELFERRTALGFLAIGPKVLAEPDKVKLEMDLIDEQIDTFGRAFLGSTLGCARCHDHKFDPVSTEDYYSLAAIFKSTRTMDDLKTVAKWHEPLVAKAADYQIKEEHDRKVAGQRLVISNFVAEANRTLLVALKTNALPKSPEKQYPTNTLARLEQLRTGLKELEAAAPELPSTMGVTESTNILQEFPVHMRGSHLKLGKPVPRAVPKVMQLASAGRGFSEAQSGRLELARWLTDPTHPLTARVMVNRIWRWHFGQGLVASTDNFGALGERPSHPELLDWLAWKFVNEGWSLKSMHRVLMLSSAYQMSSTPSSTSALEEDPENRLLARFPVRRLEAELIRDATLMVAGELDLSMGGKTIPLKNREFVFNHTSQDNTRYDSTRRAVYLPIIRNHLYDLFQQFDFPDPAVPNGNRDATVVAPQALLMMNSDLVTRAATGFARRLQSGEGRTSLTDTDRIQRAYAMAYGRPPTEVEVGRALKFIEGYQASSREEAWVTFCHTLLASSEFIYLN